MGKTHARLLMSAAPQHTAATDSFGEALCRARAEFIEMPGLKLTAAQAARLWASDFALCKAVLDRLVEMRFLVRTRDEGFQRV